MVMCNGRILAQGSQFSLTDVEVVTATVDLEEIRAYRFAPSRSLQAVLAPTYKRIETGFALSSEHDDLNLGRFPSLEIEPRYHSPEEEIALCAGAYLWDYLRRSGVAGYLV
jgi:NAD+ synthase (glutamine-hydrolysing)